jgi:hypothetical protein
MRVSAQTAFVLALVAASGCSSSSENGRTPDGATPDATGQPDSHVDLKSDAAAPDFADTSPGADLAVSMPADGPDAVAGKDAGAEATSTADAFVPGPVEPVVLGNGNTATYDLADGTWKVFSFDTVADHLYCVSGLGSDVVGYFGGSSASPYNYDETTQNGVLVFPEYATGTRYLAVAASGGSASGSFQVADGGELLTVGDNTLELTAADVNHYRVFRFNVAPGHNYTVSVTGETKNPVDLGLSPKAERVAGGGIAYPFSETTAPLPIADELVPFESTVESYTRFYFIFLKAQEVASLTVNITLAF